MRRKLLVAILSLLVLLVVVVVSIRLVSLTSPTGPSGPTGTLTGILQAVGSPAGARPQALSGQVTLHGSGGHLTGITVGAKGRFSVPVSVGTYTVTGQSPQYGGGSATCHAAGTVSVTKGATTNVRVECGKK